MDADQTPVVLAAGADDGFAMPLAVMLYSALSHLDPARSATVYIIDGGIRAGNKRKIERVLDFEQARIEWVAAESDLLEGLASTERYSVAVYFSLLVADLVPERKAIFLDCDMIVQRDLGALWDQDVSEEYLLAVPDEPTPNRAKYDLLGLAPGTKYLNAGLMVLNLEKWRADEIGRQAVALSAEKGARLDSRDQDALNATLAGQWGTLDARWNVLYSSYLRARYHRLPWATRRYEQSIAKTADPYVIHYSMDNKPWRFDCDHPDRDVFYDYARRAGWYDGAGWYAWSLPRRWSPLPYWWKAKRMGRRVQSRARRLLRA